jgi:hypothetical protein
MAAAVGIWLGLSDAIAVLIGLTGLRRSPGSLAREQRRV